MSQDVKAFIDGFRTDLIDLGKTRVELQDGVEPNHHTRLVKQAIKPHEDQFNLAQRHLGVLMAALDHDQVKVHQLDNNGMPGKPNILEKASASHINSPNYEKNGDPFQALDSLLNYFTSLVKWTSKRMEQGDQDKAPDLTTKYKELAKSFFSKVINPIREQVQSVVAELKIQAALKQLTTNGVNRELITDIGLDKAPGLSSKLTKYADSALGNDLENLLAFVVDDDAAKAKSQETLIKLSRFDLPFTASSIGRSLDRFSVMHERRFGYTLTGSRIEIVAMRLQGSHAGAPLGQEEMPGEVSNAPMKQSETREVWVDSAGAQSVQFWNRADIEPGQDFKGPAIVGQYDATLLVFPSWSVSSDIHRNILLRRM